MCLNFDMDPYQEVSVIKEILGEIEFSDFAKHTWGKSVFFNVALAKWANILIWMILINTYFNTKAAYRTKLESTIKVRRCQSRHT
ncbi:hypothetical protein ALP59_200151 [Pseudomonas savastanoi]|uniref:Uncharacterized protein n=1 Tax=Pseudomonas savastanoi TaxID=29438 RepID=A0A3M5FVW0_PSESS|nr:hypothetical protein ALP59_200151 [Pseudomonas savastanoi]